MSLNINLSFSITLQLVNLMMRLSTLLLLTSIVYIEQGSQDYYLDKSWEVAYIYTLSTPDFDNATFDNVLM